jgi:hypothetical protein
MSIVLQGSTSGSVTLQEPAIAGSTVLTLPAVSGTVLTDTSPKVGNVIQVVSASLSGGGITSSSSTFADTGLTASITPTSSSSKILVMVNHNGCAKESANTFLQVRLLRGSTTISNIERQGGYTNSTAAIWFGGISISYLDSPATTSSTTYKTQFANQAGSGVVFINTAQGGENTMSTITLMEIAA